MKAKLQAATPTEELIEIILHKVPFAGMAIYYAVAPLICVECGEWLDVELVFWK